MVTRIVLVDEGVDVDAAGTEPCSVVANLVVVLGLMHSSTHGHRMWASVWRCWFWHSLLALSSPRMMPSNLCQIGVIRNRPDTFAQADTVQE